MPRVLVIGRFRFYIWPHDHPPAHVHVYFGNEVAVIRLGDRTDEVAVVRVTAGAKLSEVRQAMLATREHRRALLRAWEDLHGE